MGFTQDQSADDERVIARTPLQLGVVLLVAVVLFWLLRARRAT